MREGVVVTSVVLLFVGGIGGTIWWKMRPMMIYNRNLPLVWLLTDYYEEKKTLPSSGKALQNWAATKGRGFHERALKRNTLDWDVTSDELMYEEGAVILKIEGDSDMGEEMNTRLRVELLSRAITKDE